MRKLKLFGLVMLLTLVASGVAIAQDGRKTTDTDPAAATFTAERTKVSERTCTGTDGVYRVAREEFRGTVVSSDPRLAGVVVLKTRSVINQTNGLGHTVGHAYLRSTDGKNQGRAALVAVNTQRGVLDGVLSGFVRGSGDAQGGTLVANFRAVFAANGLSFTGELGGGASQNTAVVQRFSGCPKAAADRGDDSGKARLMIKKGEISALTATSLSVKVGDATVTFPVTERIAKIVDELDLAVGTKVQVAYVVKGDTTTLLKLRKA